MLRSLTTDATFAALFGKYAFRPLREVFQLLEIGLRFLTCRLYGTERVPG